MERTTQQVVSLIVPLARVMSTVKYLLKCIYMKYEENMSYTYSLNSAADNI